MPIRLCTCLTYLIKIKLGLRIKSSAWEKFNEKGGVRGGGQRMPHSPRARIFIFRSDNVRGLYKKVRISASTESSLKSSDFEYSKFLTSFLKVP